MELGPRRRTGLVPRKTGVIVCHHCQKTVRNEHITLTHRFLEEKKTVQVDFCSSDCLFECLWDEEIQDEINERVQRINEKVDKEVRWFHSRGLCPACRKRILRLVHNG